MQEGGAGLRDRIIDRKEESGQCISLDMHCPLFPYLFLYLFPYLFPYLLLMISVSSAD